MTTKAKKKAKGSAPDAPEDPAPVAQVEPEPARMEAAPERPLEASGSLHGVIKMAALAVLAIAVVVLGYIILVNSAPRFQPGNPVDQETFTNLLEGTDKVYVMMDVRGVTDPDVQRNIMQCGVDFSGSTGTAAKTLVPLAVDDNECVTAEGSADPKDCFARLDDGITFYIIEGSEHYFFSNGMVIGIDKGYVQGTCGIKAA